MKIIRYFLLFTMSLLSLHGAVDADVMTDAIGNMDLVVPEHPLSSGSLKIYPHDRRYTHFTEWQQQDFSATYHLIQKIVRVWECKGINSYWIYGQEVQDSTTPFSWEVIPFTNEGSSFWKHFRVFWNLSFGNKYLSKEERYAIAQDVLDEMQTCTKENAVPEASEKYDAFCNPDVIARQLVFEGKEVYLLYNYAPVVTSGEKLHFLIIPKQHRLRLSDLTETEYVEAMELMQALINHYAQKGYRAMFAYDKSGPLAGQTVPHWHEHLIFISTKSEEFFGRMTILKNMLLGPKALPKDELVARVQALREELNQDSLFFHQ
jgi:diadenosine tetraphosphate (Ap4A) HIT family hydrolase